MIYSAGLPVVTELIANGLFEPVCANCGAIQGEPSKGRYKRVHLTRDHIVPRSKGGANVLENIQLLCWDCNQEKSNN